MHSTFNTKELSAHDYYKLVLSDPAWLLHHLRECGFRIEVIDDRIKISPYN